MTVVSSKEFATKPTKYYNLAQNEQVAIKRGKNMFHLVFRPLEKTKERVFEPDDDFYSSISADEFKERAREVVRQRNSLNDNKIKTFQQITDNLHKINDEEPLTTEFDEILAQRIHFKEIF